MPRWAAEIDQVNWSIETIGAAIAREAAAYQRPPPELNAYELRDIATQILGDGGALVDRKVFCKRDVIVAVAPALYGRNLSELPAVMARVLADPETVPLLHVAGAVERAYTTATTPWP